MAYNRGLEKAKLIASFNPDLAWESLDISTRKGKRFMIRSSDSPSTWVHFGTWRDDDPVWIQSVREGTGAGTFLNHRDVEKLYRWRARHRMIRRKDGQLAYLDPSSPSYYAWRILW